MAGAERVGRLVEWLRPGVVVFVGAGRLAGGGDRRAGPDAAVAFGGARPT